MHLHDLVERAATLVGPLEEALHRQVDEAGLILVKSSQPQLRRSIGAGREFSEDDVGVLTRRCTTAWPSGR